VIEQQLSQTRLIRPETHPREVEPISNALPTESGERIVWKTLSTPSIVTTTQFLQTLSKCHVMGTRHKVPVWTVSRSIQSLIPHGWKRRRLKIIWEPLVKKAISNKEEGLTARVKCTSTRSRASVPSAAEATASRFRPPGGNSRIRTFWIQHRHL